MPKQCQILQTSICLDNDFIDRHLILVFMSEGKLEGVYVVPIPDWLVFRDTKYPYYRICYN
ncbi:MAG: hypothetical protein KA807_11235 [Prolixibacteraceae bacterium]|jgi:hypothetical protein|nr:hypothetical protein [Prolixibacteraceae bacterium]